MHLIKRLSSTGIVLLLVILTGCVFNRTYTNQEADKDDAMQIIGKFYYYSNNKDYKSMQDMFSKNFYKVTSKSRLKTLFEEVQTKLGNRKDTNIGEWETKRIEGTNPSAEYVLRYNNTFDKAEAQELFDLVREDDGKIRIVAYRVQSDVFR